MLAWQEAHTLCEGGRGVKAIEVAVLAVQLAREDAGLYRTPRELALDAMRLLKAAARFKADLEAKRPGLPALTEARELTRAYHADLVERGDARGMTLGVRFRSASHTVNGDCIYFLS